MRNLFIWVFTILLSTLLPACDRPNSAARQAMTHAELLMDSLPDSALAIMRSIALPVDANGEDRALHALLLSQALDKNYIDVTDDSLISVADTYYRTTSDLSRRMLSSFYRGRVHYNAHDYPRALYLFTEALDLATSLDDPFWKARIAMQISFVYNQTNHPTEELQYARKAYDHGMESRQQPYLNYCILQLAAALANQQDSINHNYAESAALALLDSAEKYKDSYLRDNIYALLCRLYYWEKKWNQSIKYGESIDSSNFPEANLKGILGLSYIASGDFNNVRDIIPDTVDTSDAGQLQLAYRLAMVEGDKAKALEMQRRLLILNDSILNASLAQNLTNSLSAYYTYRSNLHEIELKQARNTRLYLAIIAAIIIFTVIFIAVKSNRSKKTELQKSLLIAENLRNILSTKDTELISAQTHIKGLFANRFTEIDNLCRRYYEFKSDKNLKKQIAKTIEHVISEFSAESPKIKELQIYLDENCNNVYTSFVQDYPDLPANDYLLFLYNGLGFSVSAITLFFDTDTTAVYNRKGRLKSRIKSTMPPRAADYLQILN